MDRYCTQVALAVVMLVSTSCKQEDNAPGDLPSPRANAGPNAPAPAPPTVISGTTAPSKIAMLGDEPMWAVVPGSLRYGTKEYEHFVREKIYQARILQIAAEQQIALSDMEVQAIKKRAPSQQTVAALIKKRGQSYADFIGAELEVGLIQKVERQQVFDRVQTTDAELRPIYDAKSQEFQTAGPRHYVTAVAIAGGCTDKGALKHANDAANALASTSTSAATHRAAGKRVLTANDGESSSVLDLHFDTQWNAVFSVPYDRSSGFQPSFGAPHIEALSAFFRAGNPNALFGPTCIEDTLWVAKRTADSKVHLKFEEIKEELGGVLRFDKEKTAFSAFFNRVIAESGGKILPPQHQ